MTLSFGLCAWLGVASDDAYHNRVAEWYIWYITAQEMVKLQHF